MLLIAGTVRLPADRLAAARPAMRTMVEASCAEDGCLAYSYAEDVLEPGLIHVAERWRDRAALDRHLAAPHLATWRAGWADLGIHDRALTLFETGGGEPF
ncbi:putative quinol monooxygenase [Sphingomonas sp. CLY1604]|uniref:putative quinol monooxygenase n=1 Tax=Sphingomonas sp. CLY1604 TaxID=3457786 RepID=UPI003FD74320